MAFLAPIAAPLAVAGTLFSGVSAWQQGKYQNQVAKNNAAIAAKNAERASDASQIEQMRSDREYGAMRAQALAAQSASGLDVLGRSQFMTRENIDRVKNEESQDIRRQGVADSQRFFQDAANFKAEGKAAKSQGRSALISSVFEAGSMIGSARSTKKGKR